MTDAGEAVGLVPSLAILAGERQKHAAAVLGEHTNPAVNQRMGYAQKACNMGDSNGAVVCKDRHRSIAIL